MPKHIYYAEIRNKIADEILSNSEILEVIETSDGLECKHDSIYSVCSEAARIFQSIQQLSEIGNVTYLSRAIHIYSDTLLEQLLRGEKPLIIDLIVMASQTIQQFC